MALFPCLSTTFFGRTTERILMSDSSFDRKCPREFFFFTIVDIDFVKNQYRSIDISILVDQCIDF